MAKKTNNTQAQAQTTQETTQAQYVKAPLVERHEVFRINAIHPALVEAHNTNNTKAIDLELCKELGIAEESLIAWEGKCESFRTTVRAFVDTFFNEDISDDDRKKLEDAIFPEWKRMLQTGEEDLKKKTLRVDPYDIYLIFKFGTTKVSTNHGTQFSIAHKKTFRKGMETVIGLKMAMNAVLSDEDRDLIKDYENAVALKNKKTLFLEGNDKQKGAKDQLTASQAQLDTLLADISTLELAAKSIETNSDAAKYLIMALESKSEKAKVLQAEVTDLKKKIGNAQDCLDKSNKLIENKQNDYEKVMSKIEKLSQ